MGHDVVYSPRAHNQNRLFVGSGQALSDGRAVLPLHGIRSHEPPRVRNRHGNHRAQLLPPGPRQQCQLLWVALRLEQPGVRARLDLLVYLCH